MIFCIQRPSFKRRRHIFVPSGQPEGRRGQPRVFFMREPGAAVGVIGTFDPMGFRNLLLRFCDLVWAVGLKNFHDLRRLASPLLAYGPDGNAVNTTPRCLLNAGWE